MSSINFLINQLYSSLAQLLRLSVLFIFEGFPKILEILFHLEIKIEKTLQYKVETSGLRTDNTMLINDRHKRLDNRPLLFCLLTLISKAVLVSSSRSMSQNCRLNELDLCNTLSWIHQFHVVKIYFLLNFRMLLSGSESQSIYQWTRGQVW